jgi:integrase
MNHTPLLDAAGGFRSPATMPGVHCGRPPRNRGLRYPADPPPVEEVVAVMRVADESACGLRTRALIVVLWRAGLRISEALALAESDLDRDRGAILVRRGKGGKRREVGMDRWVREQIDPGLRSGSPCTSERCFASSTVRRRVVRGRPRLFARRFASSRSEPACVVASRRISLGARTLSRWLARAYRST